MTETIAIGAKKYALHDEMLARSTERAEVQKVIDWIAEQGYEICEDHNRHHASRDYTEYEPIRLRQDRLVAAIMGIDYAAFMAEKDAMYEEMVS